MNYISLLIFISILTIIHSAYNPIPTGSVIISTINQIIVFQPVEYGGTDKLTTIFTATNGMTIISAIYDPTPRNLYILFTNGTSNNVYLCQLASVEQLSSTVYQLSISFNKTNINQFNSFTSDVDNRRAFLTDDTGTVQLFSMSGIMKTTISMPSTIANQIRSVAYDDDLNRLFVITSSTVNSCNNFNSNNLTCCQASPTLSQLRSIAFDDASGISLVYVLDETAGIYQVIFNSIGCPTTLRPINTLGTYSNLQFAIDRGLYFASGSIQNRNDNSILVIANGTANPRSISIGGTIVALDISVPTTPLATGVETCFHGITYNDYRVAVILAALFGTIMGIFMCFNALFCIDFFMTKRIIQNLKQQIPHNLLEDRWNRLVEEKYAKLALEKQRKKDDPPSRRISMSGSRKNSSAATTSSNDNNNKGSGDRASGGDKLQISTTRLGDYIRRRSEEYSNRRRSDDFRNQRQLSRDESIESRRQPQRGHVTIPHVEIGLVKEESATRKGLRPILSQRQLLHDDESFL